MALQDKIARSLHEISSAITDGAFQFKQVAGGLSVLGDRPYTQTYDFDQLHADVFDEVDDGGTGTYALIDRENGWADLPTAAADNDYHYLASKSETISFNTTDEVYFEANVELTEANTDDANIILGVTNTVTAGMLQDNGAGPAASYDGAVFFKVDGGTVWQFESSNADTQVTDSDIGAFVSGAATKLAFHYDPNNGTTGVITYYYNGTAAGTQNITIAGLEEMHILVGVKAGGAAAETLKIDMIHFQKQR